jgi:hypothetical protein
LTAKSQKWNASQSCWQQKAKSDPPSKLCSSENMEVLIKRQLMSDTVSDDLFHCLGMDSHEELMFETGSADGFLSGSCLLWHI